MTPTTNRLHSVVLTAVVCFVAPMVLVGILVLGLYVIHYLPLIYVVGNLGLHLIETFLNVFGNGNLLTGLILIGLVCSFVGTLFDTYTIYRYCSFTED